MQRIFILLTFLAGCAAATPTHYTIRFQVVDPKGEVALTQDADVFETKDNCNKARELADEMFTEAGESGQMGICYVNGWRIRSRCVAKYKEE